MRMPLKHTELKRENKSSSDVDIPQSYYGILDEHSDFLNATHSEGFSKTHENYGEPKQQSWINQHGRPKFNSNPSLVNLHTKRNTPTILEIGISKIFTKCI